MRPPSTILLKLARLAAKTNASAITTVRRIAVEQQAHPKRTRMPNTLSKTNRTTTEEAEVAIAEVEVVAKELRAASLSTRRRVKVSLRTSSSSRGQLDRLMRVKPAPVRASTNKQLALI